MKLTAKGVKWLKGFGLNDKQIKSVCDGRNSIQAITMTWCCGGVELELRNVGNKVNLLRKLLLTSIYTGVVVATGTESQRRQINIFKSCGFSCSRKAINPNTGNAIYILTRTIPQGLISSSW